MKKSNYRWIILSILLYATTINYIDRFLLGLLKDHIMVDLGFGEEMYGKIIAGFQIAYGLGNLFMGWLIDRIGTKLGYLISIGVWSLSSISHAIAGGATGLRISRVSLGIGESGNFPAAIKTVAEWFPKKERAFATGIFNSGSQLGIIIAGVAGSYIFSHYSWRACFLFSGILSVSWMLLWIINYKNPENHKLVNQAELEHINSDPESKKVQEKIPVKTLLKHKETWSVAIAKLFSDPVWWFYLFWGASFLNKKFNIDIHDIALPLIVIYVIADIGGIFFGGLSSWLIKKGWSLNRSRKVTLLFCVLIILPVMFVTRVENQWTAIILIALAAAGHCGWAANVFTLASDMFPRQAVGRVVGLGNATSTFGAALASIGVGILLAGAPVEGYTIPFIVAASGYGFALLALQLIVPEIKTVKIN
jgi:MFS transporter, ACS family, hexuronate transporter